MPNYKGTARGNLIASHPGHVNSVRHGVYSERVLAPRAQAIAEALMELPHVQPLDLLAAQEIGSIVARLEAIDRDLDERGHFGTSRHASARSLLEHKARLGRELRSWLDHFGGTPKSRFEFAQKLARPSLGEEIARRVREIEGATAASGSAPSPSARRRVCRFGNGRERCRDSRSPRKRLPNRSAPPATSSMSTSAPSCG